MKYKDIRKTKRYKAERAADGNVLTRSSFELLYAVIIVVFVFAVVFGTFLRIASFDKKLDNSTQSYSVISLEADSYNKGDIVTYKDSGRICAGEIVGADGDKILFGTDPARSFNRIEYKNRFFYTSEELENEFGHSLVPEGCVLINGDLTRSENQIVGVIVCEDDITGRASYIVYPFSLFGRTADYLKR